MAWSQADPGLLLTYGKDNRTLCWDTVAGEVLAELPASSNWNFDVQWSSTTPGVLSTSSFDGRVGLYNLQRAGGIDAGPGTVDQYGVQQPGRRRRHVKAPAWMRRPCGATFGFGRAAGGLWRQTEGWRGGAAAAGAVETALTLMKVSTAVEAEVSTELEGAVSTGGSDTLKTFCETKKSEATETAAKEGGRRGVSSGSSSRRTRDGSSSSTSTSARRSSPRSWRSPRPRPRRPGRPRKPRRPRRTPPSPPPRAAAAPASPVDGDEFFNNLPEPTPAAPLPPPRPRPSTMGCPSLTTWTRTAGRKPLAPARPASEPIAEAPEVVAARKAGVAARAAAMAAAAAEPVEHMDAHDAAVQRALVVGDYRAAVNAQRAPRCGPSRAPRVLASAGWRRALGGGPAADTLAANIGRPYMRVASAVVSEDLEALVKSPSASPWRETLAILCTYGARRRKPWGRRAAGRSGESPLADAGRTRPRPCVTSARATWTPSAQAPRARAAHRARLPRPRFTPCSRRLWCSPAPAAGQSAAAGLAQLVVSYAEVLVSRGQLDACRTWMDMTIPTKGDAIVTLRDRIVRGGARTTASSSAAAPAPAAPAPAPAPSPTATHTAAHEAAPPRPSQPLTPPVPTTGTTDRPFRRRFRAASAANPTAPTGRAPSRSPPILMMSTRAVEIQRRVGVAEGLRLCNSHCRCRYPWASGRPAWAPPAWADPAVRSPRRRRGRSPANVHVHRHGPEHAEPAASSTVARRAPRLRAARAAVARGASRPPPVEHRPRRAPRPGRRPPRAPRRGCVQPCAGACSVGRALRRVRGVARGRMRRTGHDGGGWLRVPSGAVPAAMQPPAVARARRRLPRRLPRLPPRPRCPSRPRT